MSNREEMIDNDSNIIECVGLGGILFQDDDNKRFYSGFQIDSLTVHVGECVRVQIEGEDEGDSNFSVAQVLAVFETVEEEMFVEVRWFSLVDELPLKIKQIIGDDPNELVETDTLDDIPAGSIVEVIRIANSSRFDTGLSATNDYICRCLVTSQSNSVQKVNPRTIKERGLRMSQYQYAYTSLLTKEAQKLERDVFSIAVQRLHISVVPQNLPCRDMEKASVTDFIRQRIIQRETSGPLFLCGMPGTGKTATVLSSINALREEVAAGRLADFNFTEINCLHLKHPIDAYTQLWRGLCGNHVAAKTASTKLKQYFDPSIIRSEEAKPMLVCLVDEFDYLLTKDYQVLFSFLEWSRSRNEKRGFLLIGIANTLDLLEQLSQRIVSRVKIEVSRISFPPYTYEQVNVILQERLAELQLPGFDPRVRELIARKAAAAAGDLRAGLKICRKTIALCKEFLETSHNCTVAELQERIATQASLLEGASKPVISIPIPRILALVQESVEAYKQSPFIQGLSSLSELEIGLLICYCDERRRVCGEEQAAISNASLSAQVAWEHLDSLLKKIRTNQYFDNIDGRDTSHSVTLELPPLFICREALQRMVDRGVLRIKYAYLSFGKPIALYYLSDRVVLSDVIAALKGRPWEKYLSKTA